MTRAPRCRHLVVAALVLGFLAVPALLPPGLAERPYAGRSVGYSEVMTTGARLGLADADAPAAAPAVVPAQRIVRAPGLRTAAVPVPAPRVAVTTPAVPAPRTATAPRYAAGWQQRHGAEALRRITYPWREMGWQITFHEARPGLLGLAYEPDRHIYVFVRKDQSIAALAFTIAHEIGHAFDFTYGTAERHDRWRQLRGIDPDAPWTGCEGCSDLATPAGDFAEVFAVWQVGPVDYRSRIAPLPSGERLRYLAREFGGA